MKRRRCLLNIKRPKSERRGAHCDANRACVYGRQPDRSSESTILIFMLYQSWIESCRPLLMSQGGHTAASLSRLEDDARWEIMNLAYPFYLRIVAVSATKKR